jgi:hypothetical protein
VAVRLENVEAETFDIAEANCGGVAREHRVDSRPAGQRPLRIVFEDQLLGRLDHVALKRDPVEARDHHQAAGHQYPAHLQRGAPAIGPVPALARANHVEAVVLERERFGSRAHVAHRETFGGVETERLLHQRGRDIQPRDAASLAREAAAEISSVGPEVEQSLPLKSDAKLFEPPIEVGGKAGAVAAVVVRGFAEIDLLTVFRNAIEHLSHRSAPRLKFRAAFRFVIAIIEW